MKFASKHNAQTFWGVLIVWGCATAIEAIAYQSYRLLLSNSLSSPWFLSVLGRYFLFRVFYSMIPVLICALLIHRYKPNPFWCYAAIAIGTLFAPAAFALAASTQFDPLILGFGLASIALLYTIRFYRPHGGAAT